MTTSAVAGRTREPESLARVEVDARRPFRSVLFPGAEPAIDREAPPFFSDLNLDQIIDAVTTGKDDYELKPFFYTPVRDIDTILYRHEIMRDLERMPVAAALRRFAQRFRELRQHLSLVDNIRYDKHNKNGWFLHATTIYCEAVRSLENDLHRGDLKSRGLVAFRDYLEGYIASDYFTGLAAEAKRIKANLSTVRYCVQISGLTVVVRKYFGEPDYSAEVAQCFDKFRQRAAKDYRLPFSDGTSTDHVEAQVLACVARLYPQIFSELEEFCRVNSDFQDQLVKRFDREIQFYLGYLEHISPMKSAGLRFCYPRITDKDKAVHVHAGFDLALAGKLITEKSSVVCNDFYLRGPERILVVSGPNQGGKTTFARAFGQAHYIASLGCPVPGTDAQLFLFDRLFTHFAREEDVATMRGALENDLARIHAILSKATAQSVIVLNEIFNSTTINDATFLARKIIEEIIRLDALGVCVTFIDELARMSEKTVSMVSTVVPDNPALRTFKIIRRPADGLAYALSIAEKHRVTYPRLIERINS
ncbi:MAG TPA: DNA mismatch repair protein MutS [Stellaceae bacterium]|nr:DNA mismatch repair protein MutS [Stellaceae bacterium]